MADDHVGNVQNLGVVDRIEENHAPECVQQDHGQCLGRTRDEEVVCAAAQAHRGRAHRVGEYIDQRKCTANYAESQARHVRQNVFILRNTDIIGHFLQSLLGLSQHLVYHIPERFLWHNNNETGREF